MICRIISSLPYYLVISFIQLLVLIEYYIIFEKLDGIHTMFIYKLYNKTIFLVIIEHSQVIVLNIFS